MSVVTASIHEGARVATNAPIVMAALGGLLNQLLGFWEATKVPRVQRPDFKDWTYYVPYALSPFVAAILGFAYETSGIHLSNLVALNVGLSAPLALRAMASSNSAQPKGIDPGKGA